MLARMQHALQVMEGRLRISRMNWLSGSRTRDGFKSAWAKRIDALGGLPEIYQGYFESQLSDDRSFPYTVLVPSFEILGHRVSEKLISAFEHDIQVLERRGDGFSVQCFPLTGIHSVEMRAVLLDAHIRINGMTSSSISASAVIQFNSVTDYLLAPILNTIRQVSLGTTNPIQEAGSNDFSQWRSSNFKFMNYARRSVSGGETVIQAILQPEIRTSRFTVLGKTFFKTISPTHAIILTDRELITIQEEALQGRKDKYGGSWVYIPLNKIVNSALSAISDDLLAFAIELPGKERFEYLFQASMKAEVDQLLGHLVEFKTE